MIWRLPGELALVDRGFNIHESAGLYCAKLPPFADIKWISYCRFFSSTVKILIHVERVGLLCQKYRYLSQQRQLTLYDQWKRMSNR